MTTIKHLSPGDSYCKITYKDVALVSASGNTPEERKQKRIWKKRERHDGTGSPCQRSHRSQRTVETRLVGLDCNLSLNETPTPSALCFVPFVSACKTVEVCANLIVYVYVRVDKALLLPSPGWQPSASWSVFLITTRSESQGTITWVGRGRTGTVNIQPEINGCAQTYGYSDVGDVFGITSSINYSFELKTGDWNSALETRHQNEPPVLKKNKSKKTNPNMISLTNV